MKYLKKMKRPQLGTILASLALIIALGGTATAASSLINGKKLKNNTVTGKKLKNKTITKNKLAPKTITALKGQKGEKGDQGVQGPKGDQGVPGVNGANGVVAPVYGEYGSLNLPANTELAIGTTAVPAGKYMITANANVFSLGTAIMGCAISTNGGGSSDSATWSSPANNSRTTLPMQMVTETSTVTQVTVACHPGTSGGAASANVIITPIQ